MISATYYIIKSTGKNLLLAVIFLSTLFCISDPERSDFSEMADKYIEYIEFGESGSENSEDNNNLIDLFLEENSYSMTFGFNMQRSFTNKLNSSSENQRVFIPPPELS